MRSGKLLMINVDKTSPNWADFDMGESFFPMAQVMDSVNWPKFDNPTHKKILRNDVI